MLDLGRPITGSPLSKNVPVTPAAGRVVKSKAPRLIDPPVSSSQIRHLSKVITTTISQFGSVLNK